MEKRILYLLLLILNCSSVWSQGVATVSGKITDNKSNPVPNASVHILNTYFGAITDEQGKFTITQIPAGVYIMEISAIGFATIHEDVSLTKGNKEFSITLTEAARILDDIVVSAQKKEELMQHVPISISAFSSGKVQEYRLWNSRELTAIVPNLYSANSGDDRNVTSIRGITTTSYDPAVATYIDGVNQFGLDTYIANLLDVERIEVLRGPQGTLYGRNAMGGVINIITRQPSNRTEGFAELNFGNHQQQRYSIGLRTPLVKNKVFFGISGVYNTRDGFYSNEFNNSRYDRQHSLTGNYYLKWLASPRWNITVNVKNHNNRNSGPFPLVFGVQPAFQKPFQLNQNAISKMIDNTFNSSLSVSHAGKIFNFTSQTAYQSNLRYYNLPLDGDFSPLDGITIINNYGKNWNKVKVWTQEFRFTSSPSSVAALKWTAGTYFFYQDNPVKQTTHFGEDAELLGAPDKNFSLINTNKGKSTGAALYGQFTYSFLDQLYLIAGIRYDYEKKKYSVLGEYQKQAGPVMVIRPDTSAEVSYHAISPKLGLAYQLDQKTNLYVSYSMGYRAGGLTQLSIDPSQPPLYPYKPEYSNNLEAGIKNSFAGNRLRLNAVIFFTQVNHAQVPTLIIPDAITVTRNAGKLTSKGVELEMESNPVKGLQVDYNFGYTDAKYKILKLSQGGAEVDLSGKHQIFTPDFTSLLAIQYSHDLVSKHSLKLIVRGEWAVLGKQYFDLANTITQSSYSLFNTRCGITIRNFGIFLWGRNLGDKKYIAYAYDFGAVHLGDPKTYGITLTGRL